MKFSEKWLREWVDPPVDTAELVTQLTTAGLEVDTVEPVAGPLEGIVVGEVLSVEPHPDADRLRVCRVNAGDGEHLQIVCGAPNVHAGMRAPLAPLGVKLPGGIKIKKAKLRGVESTGMLCSEAELGMADSADGLMALPADAPAGADLVDYLGLDDVSIDIDLTPNRGDCLSVAGTAREVGVRNQVPVDGPAMEPVPAEVDETFEVSLEAPADCARYVGRVIRDINPDATTPLWMQERLRRSGLRPISPVVDVTNYVLLELGQPMHAFDLDKLQGRVRVRHAAEGERIMLLDGTDLALKADTLIIADESVPVALAGIMGGMESAVTETTRHIFLESAFFAPHLLAGEARGYGLHTDSSHRFERGVDPELQRRAAERATALLLDIVGGRPGPVVEVAAEEHLPRREPVRLRQSRIRRLLGIDVDPGTVVDAMERLGMQVAGGPDEWQVTPPSFRFDIALEADLIEEIARIVGYDAIPSHAPHAGLPITREAESRVTLPRIEQVLVHRGYQEAVTYSFVDERLQSQIEPDVPAVRLANPISSDMAVMRTTTWPGLLQAVLHNTKRQQRRVRLFESGLVFRGDVAELEQERVVGGAVVGPAVPPQWGADDRDADFFDIKADVEAVLQLTGTPESFQFVPTRHPALHPGQAAAVEREGQPVGLLGALHPAIAKGLKAPGRVLVFELRLAGIESGHVPNFQPLSKFPAVRRDIAVVLDESVPAAEVRNCVGQAGTDVLKNLEFFDLYRGEGIDSGKKSLALGLTFQHAERTLADDEVDGLVGRVIDSLRERFGAVLRG